MVANGRSPANEVVIGSHLRSVSAIALQLGIDRKTVRKYSRSAK